MRSDVCSLEPRQTRRRNRHSRREPISLRPGGRRFGSDRQPRDAWPAGIGRDPPRPRPRIGAPPRNARGLRACRRDRTAARIGWPCAGQRCRGAAVTPLGPSRSGKQWVRGPGDPAALVGAWVAEPADPSPPCERVQTRLLEGGERRDSERRRALGAPDKASNASATPARALTVRWWRASSAYPGLNSSVVDVGYAWYVPTAVTST